MVAFNFKEWFVLKEARGQSFADYIRGGMVHLFHYTPYRVPEIELTPENFGKNPWSMREKRTATMKRVYFYLDLRDKEGFFGGNTLYEAIVPASQIYDLAADPDQMIAKGRSNGFLNIDDLLADIKKEGYKGVYYNNGMHLVAWFEPIKASRVEEKEVLEKHFNTSWEGIQKEKDEEKAALQKQREEDDARRHKEWEEDQERRKKWWADLQAQRQREREEKERKS